MHIRLRDDLAGSHVHTRVFVGPDADHLALAGTTVLRVGEWQALWCALSLGVDLMGAEHITFDHPDADTIVKEINDADQTVQTPA